MPQNNTSKTTSKTSSATAAGTTAMEEVYGFTIANVTSFIPDFGQRPLFLGWIFKFANYDNQDPANRNPINKIKEIEVIELSLKIVNGTYEISREPLNLDISPKMHRQLEEPTFRNYPVEKYSDCIAATESKFTDASLNTRIDQLENHKYWADAAYIRATDLRLLKVYLSTEDGYDDIFFSGSKVDYNTMHNARLRLEQRYFFIHPDCVDTSTSIIKGGDPNDPDDQTSIKNGRHVLNTSKAFTLKAEPIATEGRNNEFGIENEMMPGTFNLVACPKYWTLLKAINEEATAITGSLFGAMVDESNLDNLNELNTFLDNNATTNLQPETWLGKLLRALADMIDGIVHGTA